MEASGYYLNQTKRRDRAKRHKSDAYERLMMGLARLREADGLQNRVDEDLKEDHEITSFRDYWTRCYAANYGSFEDSTVVPPMLYTFQPIPGYATPDNGVQIFSVKIAQVKEEEGLQWPLHVYGTIGIRDSVDPRRNLLFHRKRDDCQILTQEDPFLLLTGPSRAVILIDPITFEVQLKAKGKIESEDKLLNFGILHTSPAWCYLSPPAHIVTESAVRNRSEVELAFAVLARSVEATICVEIVDGSWPLHFRGLVITRTASIVCGDIVLLDSRDGGMPISHSGVIELSRRTVSVELSGELKIDVVARQLDKINVVAKGQIAFTPKKSTISVNICDLGFCKMRITVAWSLVPPLVDSSISFYMSKN